MLRRFEALDGLRGVAAIAVVLFHVKWSNHVTETHFIREGYLFVDLFFILSGFIITRTYGNKIHSIAEIARFLLLRFFRLYPLHIAVLLVFVTYEAAKLAAARFGLQFTSFGESTSAWTLVPNLLLIESLGIVDLPTWNVPSWSISCEVTVYILFAVAAVRGFVNGRYFFVHTFGAAAISYALVLHYKGSLFALTDLGLFRCLAGFCVGAAVSKIPQAMLARLPGVAYDAAAISLFMAVAMMLALLDGVWTIFVVPVFALLILLLQADRGIAARILTSKPIALLGRTSYSIYMVHWFLLVIATAVLKHVLGDSSVYDGKYFPIYRVNPLWGDLGVLLILTLVVGIAIATYRSIEVPWRSFGRRLAVRM
jgi:peptidoglycan/LPS O-acetylase OafA/YrhL